MTFRSKKGCLLFIAILVCATILPTLSSCNKSTPCAIEPCAYYDINMTYEDGKIEATQDMMFRATDNFDRLVFHIYANAFDKQNDAIDILSAKINRQTADFEIYGEDSTLLKLPCDIKRGELFTVAMRYNVTVPKSNTRLGITSGEVANLACFYPVIARYDGGWREDCYSAVGDPFYSDVATFCVSVTFDSELEIASSGNQISARLVGDNKKHVDIEAENIRDFAMAIGKFNCACGEIKNENCFASVKYYYFDDPSSPQILHRAISALSAFSDAFGAYPHDTLTIVQSPLDAAGGMEYGTFVTVSPCESRDEYLDVITHEIAHQWWYGAVGNDQINAAWLDEGLAEFCTYYYYRLVGDNAKYASAMRNLSQAYSSFAQLAPAGFNGKMNRPLYSYLTEGEYVAVNYFKGALLFDTLLGVVGESKFQNAMRKYFDDNLFKVANEKSLITSFTSQGCDVSGIINAWIKDEVYL